jgi:predicted nucleic acid-binding protein
MACLVDTSVLIDAERGGQALDRVADDEEQLISVITASELLHGVHRAIDDGVRTWRRACVERALVRFELVPIDLRVARVHAEVRARLQASGEIIGARDLWIAATALAHGLQVATSNAREFERVPGLAVLAL